MEDEARPAPLDPPARLPHAPWLTIRYIMLVTSVTAVVLTVLSQRIGEPQRQRIWPVLVLAAVASLLGWGYSAVLLIAWHALRRTLWRLEPGEWLLLCATNVPIAWVFDMPLHEWLMRRFFGTDPYSYAAFKMAGYFDMILPGEMAVVYLIAAFIQRKRTVWCAALVGTGLYFSSFFLRTVWKLSPQGFIALWMFLNCGIVSLLVAGVVLDRRARQSRHWIHWSGIALTGCAVITMAVAQVWALY